MRPTRYVTTIKRKHECNGNAYLRFEVFTLGKVMIVVLLVVIPCSFVYGYRHFGSVYCLRLQC
jgi:hypothetical protein